MTITSDAIVVGGGVMGCAAARSLAARGLSVRLFEARAIGTAEGSSHGRSRIIRLAYGEAGYIPLCRAAYAAWDAVGAGLMQRTGGLDLAEGERASWGATAEAMTAAGVPYETLDGDELRRRYPQFRLAEGARALFQPDAAVLHADLCLAALARAAREHGADLREGEAVQAVVPGGDHVEVTTMAGRYAAARLVLAPGAGMAALAAQLGLGLALTVSQEQVGFFAAGEAFGPGRFPLFILHLDGRRFASGFPVLREGGVKLMIEHKQADDDNTRLDALRRHARRILPDLGPLRLAENCTYTLTPDEDFILDRHPAWPHIVIASACSGHGFKFAALFGDALAALCLGADPGLAAFRLDRPALKGAA